jgi:hypothetical protein
MTTLSLRDLGFIGGLSGGDADPYFANVSLLLHGNGANGSTAITDSSPNPKIVTAVGNAQISTAQSKFGGASIAFDGTGDVLSVGSSSDLVPGASNFTIEFWVRHTAGAGQFMYSNPNFAIGLWPSGTLALVNNAGANVLTDSENFLSATWIHVAVTRDENVIRLFKDGNLVASATNSVSYSTAGTTRVGSWLDGNNFFFNGYVDELRKTIGVFGARYTANFAPPTAPFPDS